MRKDMTEVAQIKSFFFSHSSLQWKSAPFLALSPDVLQLLQHKVDDPLDLTTQL